MSMEQWWPHLSPQTRDWLVAHNGEALAPDVVAEITRVGGAVRRDDWWVGEESPDGVLLSEAGVDWVEAMANGETPTAPGPIEDA